jgi:hypothetical protein
VTFFQKVVSKSSAGYHAVVWAEFNKVKTGMGNYRINMMIVSNIMGHGHVCRALKNRYCEISKMGSMIVTQAHYP